MVFEYSLTTPKENLINITSKVREAVKKSGVENGICVVYCPHTTAAITINENTDSDVIKDVLMGLGNAFPNIKEYKHMEGNSFAHIKSSCVGASETIIVENGQLKLGVWQSIYFCEFDGPRQREFYVKVM